MVVRVRAPSQWLVNVDHSGARSGRFDLAVSLTKGQSFTIIVRKIGQHRLRRYFVRCLPADFPAYSFERGRAVDPPYFIVTPIFPTSIPTGRYVAIFNRQGVPMWWYENPTPVDAKLLSDGSIAWNDFGFYLFRRLDGSLIRQVQPIGGVADLHDLQELPNGNYALGLYKGRDGVDLSQYGGPADATVVDAEIQEITPDNDLVWSWNSKDHIGLDETGRWWANALNEGSPYDIVHWNSIEFVGDSMIISMRHTDAVYKIDRTTGEIIWKLGGTTTPESLTVEDDPESDYPLGGQHDARVLADGSLTIYDNRTALGEPPRAVRYEIDESAQTATLLETVADPEVTSSFCCGSARLLASGNWLINWGGNGPVGGYTATGARSFKLDFDQHFTYRAHPVLDGQLSRQRMRNGMNAMYPRP